jgi:phage-related protein
MVREDLPKPKPVLWMGSSRIDLKTFPEDVPAHIGYALYAAQCGEEYATVKALKGFGSRSVLEIIAPHESDTYRAVYTVRFKDAIYVLHAFQKKSKKGIATPGPDMDLIRRRLADAMRLHEQRRK